MESLLIWIITAGIVLVIIIPYFIKFRKEHQKNVERKKEARQLGIDRPTAQFPFIDAASCIGCGSCVKACPEGDVLGVIFGKATVINGLRCVGHGLCEEACPVGAIEVGLGDIKSREDIPFTNEHHETNVPGLYVVGELGGLSLIRNAVKQGQAAVNQIASDLETDSAKQAKDVIIVGAGPAGLSAALTAIQHRLDYLILDQYDPGGTILQYPRRKLVMTQIVNIPLYGRLKKPEFSKEELLDIWKQIIENYKINIKTGTKISQVVKVNGTFEVVTSRGHFQARKVVLAMGRRGTPRKLGVPGEDKSKVAYQLIDAGSYQNQNILVVGGGDSAIEAAVGLARQPGNNVTISYRKEKFFRIKQKNEQRISELITRKKIQALFNSNVTEIKDKSVILTTGEGEQETPNNYVFIFAGGIPPFKMLKEMGIAFGGETQEIQKERENLTQQVA